VSLFIDMSQQESIVRLEPVKMPAAHAALATEESAA